MDWYAGLDLDAKNVFSILQRNSNHMLELLNELGELGRLNTEAEKIELQELSV